MDLTLSLAKAGQPTTPLTAEAVGALTREEWLIGAAGTGLPYEPNLTKIRARHHQLAKLLAEKVSEGDAAIMAGYDPSRVSILKRDPAFKELIAFYEREHSEVYRDFHTKLATVADTAADILLERLEDEEKQQEFSNGQILEIVKVTADRTGYGPQSKNLNVNVNVDLAERLQQARMRARGEAPKMDAAE